jgi:hypothetical protein
MARPRMSLAEATNSSSNVMNPNRFSGMTVEVEGQVPRRLPHMNLGFSNWEDLAHFLPNYKKKCPLKNMNKKRYLDLKTPILSQVLGKSIFFNVCKVREMPNLI